MAGPDGEPYDDSYENYGETTTLMSLDSSQTSEEDHNESSPAAGQKDERKHYKYALGTGYMFGMGVCGTVLVALGSTLDDLAENCGTTATDVRGKERSFSHFSRKYIVRLD